MLNEFRQDPVSGDWVLFATGRAHKPAAREQYNFNQDKQHCPFEPDRMAEQEKPVLVFQNGKEVSLDTPDWTVQVIPNKYPAISAGVCSPVHHEGPIPIADGKGFHELVITRDHDAHFVHFTKEQTAEILKAYVMRYNAIAETNCGEYISVFHNHGHLAGASVYHNHSQILSMPVIPSLTHRNFKGAEEFFQKTGERIYSQLLEWELKEKKRIVYENERFVVLCPYVSKVPYEMRIFSRDFSSDFTQMNESDLLACADVLNTALKKLYRVVENPDYIYFIHTAPTDKKHSAHGSYQWHIEIMPRISVVAGFELGTNTFINIVDPDEAAQLLREANV